MSAEQALADAAYFVVKMRKLYNLTADNKWVTFGGSYSGELAAWARLKYPNLFHAALASSAPVTASHTFQIRGFEVSFLIANPSYIIC